MPRPENHSKNRRKLSKVAGKSYAVTMPVDIIRHLEWEQGENLIVRREGSRIIIEKGA